MGALLCNSTPTILLISLLVTTVITGQDAQNENEDVFGDHGNANEYVDKLFAMMRQDARIHQGIDPLTIPEPLVVKDRGQITQVNIAGLKTLHRTGNSTLTIDPRVETMKISASLGLNDLVLRCRYNLKPIKSLAFALEGGIEAHLEHVSALIALKIFHSRAILQRFEILHLGTPRITKFTGTSKPLNPLVKMVFNKALKSKKEEIRYHLEKTAVETLSQELRKIDIENLINGLGPQLQF